MRSSLASNSRLAPLALALLGMACSSAPSSSAGGAGTGPVGSGGSVDGAAGNSSTAGGSSTGGAGPTQLAEQCAKNNGALNAGVTPLRRLTRDQFKNTVRDLIGVSSDAADNLPDDEKIGPFHSNAIAPITTLQVQQHMEVANALALAAAPNMAKISPCDLTKDTGTATTCATQFVTDFGRRAYRRPLTADEVQQYLKLYNLGKAGAGVPNGFRLVIQTMLQSPFFLYNRDVGTSGTPVKGVVAVSPYELASRMSYFLWNTMPDEPLFTAAAAGSLATDAALTSQVTRMLADPKAATTIASFHSQWLDVEDVGEQLKDTAQFAGFNKQLTDAMSQELSLFSNYVVLKGDGLLKTLLTSTTAFPQGGLFSVYGVTQPAGFAAGTPVTLDATRRAGILTQAAFLTKWSHSDQTSPVHRGKLVRLNLLCGFIDSPPPAVDTTPPPPTPTSSTRERFTQHEADPVCGSCHVLMDPIGLAFEHFDSIGAYRDVDGVGKVDATGKIVGGGADLDGAFNGAVELANKLANSSQVRDCVANQWFRFSLGRIESQDDACTVQALHENFSGSGGNVRDLLTKIVLSPSFRSVRLNGN